jgi:hypothetical protein
MEGYLEYNIDFLLKMTPSRFERWLTKIHMEHELLDVSELVDLFKGKEQHLKIIKKVVR